MLVYTTLILMSTEQRVTIQAIYKPFSLLWFTHTVKPNIWFGLVSFLSLVGTSEIHENNEVYTKNNKTI